MAYCVCTSMIQDSLLCIDAAHTEDLHKYADNRCLSAQPYRRIWTIKRICYEPRRCFKIHIKIQRGMYCVRHVINWLKISLPATFDLWGANPLLRPKNQNLKVRQRSSHISMDRSTPDFVSIDKPWTSKDLCINTRKTIAGISRDDQWLPSFSAKTGSL